MHFQKSIELLCIVEFMLEDITLKFEKALKQVTGQGRLSEKNISDTLREIRRVLLDADVNYKVAKQFIDDVKVKALGQEVLSFSYPWSAYYKNHL